MGDDKMLRRYLRWILVAIVALVLVLVVLRLFGYHTSEFRGGGRIRDSGLLAYPRYTAEIGRFPMAKAGTYEFAVRGLPSESLDLMLDVEGATDAQRSLLASLSNSIALSVKDSVGRVVCTASGSLSDAEKRVGGGWTLASSASSAAFWNGNCLSLPVSRSRTAVPKAVARRQRRVHSMYCTHTQKKRI